ncbi:MAG TPA: PQQ-binding-like beta-propeller repeat protein [Gemmataceae bacterium]|nr:PQQ-binding-like beta-propeller repeat protein [Gemmataceae bacterium]
MRCLILISVFTAGATLHADDWPMGGRSSTRNPVSPEKHPITDWQVPMEEAKAHNIRWSVEVGDRAIGGPVVAGGLVWVGTNNIRPLDPKLKDDRAILACFRATDGKFVYQYAAERLPFSEDWPHQGLSGSPLIEGDRLWFCTNRREVVCLYIGSLQKGTGQPRVLWKFDMVKELGIQPRAQMIPGSDTQTSPAAFGDYLYVATCNGTAEDHHVIPAPEAPSLVCINKTTGKVVWSDNSPGKDLMSGQYASPLVVKIDDRVQVIHPQGDGWVRSFDAMSGKLLWKFDVNKKGSDWEFKRSGEKSKVYVLTTPVLADNHVLFATGIFPEAYCGPGRLFCVDPKKSGDVSPEIDDGKGTGKPNPNSAVVWEYGPSAKPGEGINLTQGSVAIDAGLVIASDVAGYIHCVDAKDGKRLWSHDTKSTIKSHPLIVDDKIFVGNEDSDVTILQLDRTKRVIARHEMGHPIVAPLVYSDRVLYVLTESRLFGISDKK